MDNRHIKPGSPGDILKHHGVKGMRWGVRKEEDSGSSGISTPAAQTKARRNSTQKQKIAQKQRTESTAKTDSVPETKTAQKHGLTRNQKMLLTFGALTAAGAGYYAYQHYAGAGVGGKMPNALPRRILREHQQVKQLEDIKLPAKWDVSELAHRPISTNKLGDLAAGEFNVKLKDAENLVVNTSRGYADILPKEGLSSALAAETHASFVRVLEQMRDKYPAVRNMNVELVPMSKVAGMENSKAYGCVTAMRAGEARLVYNDFLTDPPSADMIRRNADFIPGLGKKDYTAYHEMGHLLAAAHGDIPPGMDIMTGNAGLSLKTKYSAAKRYGHMRTFHKHGFSFDELSKISGYAATQPSEAMAELFGHYSHPELRSRLTPDQLTRAEAMFNEMGGVATG